MTPAEAKAAVLAKYPDAEIARSLDERWCAVYGDVQRDVGRRLSLNTETDGDAWMDAASRLGCDAAAPQ